MLSYIHILKYFEYGFDFAAIFNRKFNFLAAKFNFFFSKLLPCMPQKRNGRSNYVIILRNKLKCVFNAFKMKNVTIAFQFSTRESRYKRNNETTKAAPATGVS